MRVSDAPVKNKVSGTIVLRRKQDIRHLHTTGGEFIHSVHLFIYPTVSFSVAVNPNLHHHDMVLEIEST